MEYTRITPAGEEKCSLLDGDGMTIEEKAKAIAEHCKKSGGLCLERVGGNFDCPLYAPEFDGQECYRDYKFVERNYQILVDAGYIKPPVNFVKANPDDEIEQADDAINSGLADSGTRREFASGAVRDIAEGKGDMVSFPNAAILRLSKHYEAGAKKYGRWNYTKGIPVSSFMDSALRHIFKYLDGWDDEDHLAAAAFNVLGAMQMEAKHPELIDVPNREGKNRFEYKEDNR